MNKSLEELFKANPKIREIYDRLPDKLPRLKTKVVTELEGKIASAARANPESVKVRVTATDEDNVTVVDRPRAVERIEVVAVDGNGRAVRANRYDVGTGEWGMVEFEDGYRKSGVESSYDPIKRFEEGLGE